jgi:hypothetical protein
VINPYLSTSLIFYCLLNTACVLEKEENNSFKVKGDIYELEGDLILSINDNEELIISNNLINNSNQKFSFRQRFNTGNDIQISITKQPDSQYCKFIKDRTNIGISFSDTITDHDFDEIGISCRSYSRISNNPESLSADYFHTCIIDNNGPRCLGEDWKHSSDTNITQIPSGLVNPRKITSSDTHGCVIDDTGVVCWGKDNQTDSIPKLDNPREVKAGSGFSCALDDLGLKCWGWELLATEVPMDIVNAANLSVGRASACVLDNGQPICRATYDALIEIVPDLLDHATYMSTYEETACAIQDNKLYCWGGWVNPDTYGAELNSTLSQFYLGLSTYCLASEKTVACTDQPSHTLMEDMISIMPDAKSIELGIYHICAMNNDDTVCFGNHFANQESHSLSN